jgi:hypothetical protein
MPLFRPSALLIFTLCNLKAKQALAESGIRSELNLRVTLLMIDVSYDGQSKY